MVIYHAKILLIPGQRGWDGPAIIEGIFNSLSKSCEKYNFELFFEGGLEAEDMREPIIIIREK